MPPITVATNAKSIRGTPMLKLTTPTCAKNSKDTTAARNPLMTKEVPITVLAGTPSIRAIRKSSEAARICTPNGERANPGLCRQRRVPAEPPSWETASEVDPFHPQGAFCDSRPRRSDYAGPVKRHHWTSPHAEVTTPGQSSVIIGLLHMRKWLPLTPHELWLDLCTWRNDLA